MKTESTRNTDSTEPDLHALMDYRRPTKPTGVATHRRRKTLRTGPRAIVLGRHAPSVLAIVVFLLLALTCIFTKGDVRAGFKTVNGEIFIEAKEQSKPAQPKTREEGDQKSIRTESRE